MVKFINRATGTIMWVADERVDEYKAAGHSLAADVSAEEPAEKPKKTRKAKKEK